MRTCLGCVPAQLTDEVTGIPSVFLNVKSCNDGVSHSILLTEMGAMMELRLIAEGLRKTQNISWKEHVIDAMGIDSPDTPLNKLKWNAVRCKLRVFFIIYLIIKIISAVRVGPKHGITLLFPGQFQIFIYFFILFIFFQN